MRSTVILVCTLFGAPSSAEAPSADLMQRLAAHAQASKDASANGAVTVKIKSEELNKDGTVKSTDVRTMRVSRKGGETKTELLSSQKDGVDSTEASRKQMLERESKPNDERKGEVKIVSPFAESEQPNHTFTVVGADAENPKYVRISLAPKEKRGPTIWYGDATVDPERGELVRLSIRPSENPRFVSSMSVDMRFDFMSPKGRLVSWVKGQGAGGFLMFQKRMRVETLFSAYSFE
jgi:outer membrane lipoprotein-sorting protein